MKKLITSFVFATFVYASASAFSLKDAVNSISTDDVATVVTAITGGSTVSTSNITGTWNYSSPAVSLTSDSALTEAAGTLATSQIETKLSSVYSTAGITASSFSFTFNSDLTFSCTTKSKTLSGTYTVGTDQVVLSFSALSTVNLGSMTVNTSISGSTLSLLFNADKLLSIVSAISSVSDSLSTINTLLSNYDGVMVGFNLTK